MNKIILSFSFLLLTSKTDIRLSGLRFNLTCSIISSAFFSILESVCLQNTKDANSKIEIRNITNDA